LGTWVANTKLGKFPLEQGDISQDHIVTIPTKLLTKLLMSEMKDLRKRNPKVIRMQNHAIANHQSQKKIVKKNPMFTPAQTT